MDEEVRLGSDNDARMIARAEFILSLCLSAGWAFHSDTHEATSEGPGQEPKLDNDEDA